LLSPGKYLFDFYQGIFPLKANTLAFSPLSYLGKSGGLRFAPQNHCSPWENIYLIFIKVFSR